MNLADNFRNVKMGWIWSIVFLLVVLFGQVMTPWEAIEQLLTNGGVGEEGAAIIGFVAGFTLPLTIGFGIVTFLFLMGVYQEHHWTWQVLGAAVILWFAGELSRAFGLGLLPDYGGWHTVGGHLVFRPLFIVLQAYFNTYGWSLMVCALAIGFAVAMQVERWLHPLRQSASPHYRIPK